jgi:iron complex transport system ATP-binding protein
LDISKGSFTGIIGPNGSGKTTLLKLILKILHTEESTVFLNSQDITELSRKTLAQRIAYVPQELALDFDFTIKEIVQMGRNPYLGRFQLLSAYDKDVVNWAMEQAEIYPLKDKLITKISGGEAQRVIIARALAQEPEILALDEPTNHLDIHHQIRILSLIRKLSKEKNLTVVSILHNINHALEYCDHLFLMEKGKVPYGGAPDSVITPENLKSIYQLETQLKKNPFTGKSYIIHQYE